jgi:hypothetical protein
MMQTSSPRDHEVRIIIGPKLPFLVARSIANRIWGSLGLLEVLSSDNGFFLFSFDSVEHASAILDCALWHMANRHFSLEDGYQTCNFIRLSYPEFLSRLSFIMFP